MIISQDLVEMHEWEKRLFSVPSPVLIRKNCLNRFAIRNALWVDVAGCKNELTEFIKNSFPVVISIVNSSANKTEISNNVVFHFGPREIVLASLLKSITGNVNFYIQIDSVEEDSCGDLARTGILTCVNSIANSKNRLQTFNIFIDMGKELYSDIKLIEELVDLSKLQGFKWYIEHGVFIILSQ